MRSPWNGTDFELRLILPREALKLGELVEFGCRITEPNGIRLVIPSKVTLAADNEWLPFVVTPGVKKGSVLDFTSVCGIDAPAGKYGNVVVRNGHFEFANRPGVPQRFYGVNLCFNANFVDFADAKAFAKRLARLGYNSIRIHHYERTLTEGSSDGTTINPSRMKQLDGLLAAIWASAVDGKPLAESSRVLLTHLTDVQNTGTQYADDSHRVLLDWGTLPHLMRRGQAEIRLKTKGTKVYALRSNGERCGEVHSRRDGKFLSFTADTGCNPGSATYLYEICETPTSF